MNPLVPDPSLATVSAPSASAVNGVDGVDLDPAVLPNLDALVTEDDTPLDSIFTEKQQRLLTEPLYVSWPGPGKGRPFLVLANVGWFYANKEPPVVPDVLLSIDVKPVADVRTKEGRSYFQWVLGKPPDVVLEIVSDRRGGEEDHKKRVCARQGVSFYVIFDPDNLLGGGLLRSFTLDASLGEYNPINSTYLPKVGLGLVLWTGVYEDQHQTWLRWCDPTGRVIPTGAERADEEHRRAEEATARAERLAVQLRSLGIEPET